MNAHDLTSRDRPDRSSDRMGPKCGEEKVGTGAEELPGIRDSNPSPTPRLSTPGSYDLDGLGGLAQYMSDRSTRLPPDLPPAYA